MGKSWLQSLKRMLQGIAESMQAGYGGYNKKSPSFRRGFFYCLQLVPEAGVEPALPFGNMTLNHARLPIPPPGRCFKERMQI